MTIDQAYQFVQFVLNKDQSGYISPDQFNNISPIAQMALINDRIGNVKKYRQDHPIPVYGFGMNQKTREELRMLLVKPTNLTVTAGVATIPNDYLYYDTLAVSGKQAQECTEDEIVELLNSKIKPPTAMFPKVVVHSNGFNVYPTNSAALTVSYLRKPASPKWNYTGNPAVYNPTGSQDFETSETTHLEICNRILQFCGLNLKLDEIVQWSEMAEQTGK